MRGRSVLLVYTILTLLVTCGSVLAQSRGPVTAVPPPEASDGAAEQENQITFTGKILDADGQPLSEAEVSFYLMTYTASLSSRNAALVAQQQTGADGAFSFSAPKEADGYREGSFVARKEGLAMGWIAWRLQGDEEADIRLGAPKQLVGTVVDQAGAPVPDAEVGIPITIVGKAEDRRYLSIFVAPKILTTTTDDSGKFLFADMPAEATFEFLVKKAGHATLCTFNAAAYRGEKLQYAPEQADIALTLPPEAQIEGVVTNKTTGKPVAGVEIITQPEERGLPLPPEPVATGEDGAFRFGALPAGGYTVQLNRPADGVTEYVASSVEVTVKAGETRSGVKLQVSKGGVIEIVVKDEADDTPVEKASVNVRDPETDQRFHGSTDESGIARIRVPAGQYAVSQAYKRGYNQQRRDLQVTVEEGQTKKVEWTLTSAPKITGTVRNQAGDPVAGVKLEVKPDGGATQPTTDADGKYELAWERAGWNSSDTIFVLVARDMERNLAALEEIDEDTRNLDITLQPGGSFTGTVLDHEGKPMADARVRVWLHVSNWGTTLGREQITTEADGTFETKAIPPEREYNVMATAEGFGKHGIKATATSGAVEVGTFKLPLADLDVTGVVVDVNDEPVANARIYFYGDGQPDYSQIQSDENGKFEIKGVCKGRLNVNANTRGTPHMYGRVETEGGATDVKIIVAEQSTSRTRFVPRKPASLVGKPLPDLKSFGLELEPKDTEGKMLLLCFWDIDQRPSRHCIRQLEKASALLTQNGVTAIAVQAVEADAGALEQWLEEYGTPFRVGRMTGDFEKVRFQWGAASLPHLILTDKEHKVMAEGFSVRELEEKIQAASGG